LGDAVVADREFFRTAGRHREDGSYEVRRRGADSTGNAKVFPSFAAVERLYERLPESFTAEDVGRTGITGSRRHMLVRHFAEHPAFACTIETRSPLRATKRPPDGDSDVAVTADSAASTAEDGRARHEVDATSD
jgi:hypothetical protein